MAGLYIVIVHNATQDRIGSVSILCLGFCVHFHADFSQFPPAQLPFWRGTFFVINSIPWNTRILTFSIHVTQLWQQLVNPLQSQFANQVTNQS